VPMCRRSRLRWPCLRKRPAASASPESTSVYGTRPAADAPEHRRRRGRSSRRFAADRRRLDTARPVTSPGTAGRVRRKTVTTYASRGAVRTSARARSITIRGTARRLHA
jgi:hypothetical protein